MTMRSAMKPNLRTTMPDFAISWHRIAAMLARYWYVLRASWPRLLELVYWPAVNLLMWGFLQLYITQKSGYFAAASGTFIGGMLLWDFLFRGQLGFSMSFIEEMWSGNFTNLLISPLRPAELIIAMMIMSSIRLFIGMGPVSLIAIGFFGFNLYSMGLALAVFFLNLILTSWAVGIFVSGAILRNGLGSESLAWTVMFPLMPLTCVFYPVSVLPPWLQVVAWSLPPTYVFEGMRALLIDHQFRSDLMIDGFLLNMVLCGAGVAGFLMLLSAARRKGALINAGE